MRTIVISAAVIATSLLTTVLSGCSAPNSGDDSPNLRPLEPAVSAIPLDRLVGYWELVEYTTEAGDVHVIDPDFDEQDNFDERGQLQIYPSGRLQDTSLCNSFDGPYLPTDGVVTLKNIGISTVLSCANYAGSAWLWERGVRLTLDGDSLTVTAAGDLRTELEDPIRSFEFSRVSTDPDWDGS